MEEEKKMMAEEFGLALREGQEKYGWGLKDLSDRHMVELAHLR